MKHQISQILNRHIVADATVAKFVQYLCFVASIFVLALSLRTLSRLDLTEPQMFFGVLLSFVTPMLFIIGGLLMPMAIIAAKLPNPKGKHRSRSAPRVVPRTRGLDKPASHLCPGLRTDQTS